MKYAVIDIGSNSVRLLLESDGKTLYKRLNSTRLGEGLALTKKLSVSAMNRTALAVSDFQKQAIADGAVKVYAFATAAVRSAENGKDFVSLVQSLSGLEIDVISGEEEAAVGLLGAIGKQDGGIIDIGGGSTEVTLQTNGKVVYSKSLDIGAVRLYDLCGRNRQTLQSVIDEKISEYGKIDCLAPMYAIGGTATSLGAFALGLKEYVADKVHGFVFTKEKLEETAEVLFCTSPEEIANVSCLPVRRAEIIAGGALFLFELMKYMRLERITVSEADNLEGYLLKRLSL